jgi:hypothetical protein
MMDGCLPSVSASMAWKVKKVTLVSGGDDMSPTVTAFAAEEKT